MFKRIISILLLVITLDCAPKNLKPEYIPDIMRRFFYYHIENKSLSPTIVRRWFKIYIEHFDPDKTYLTQEEVKAYLEISDSRAQEISAKIQRRDFSDFYALNYLMQNAVHRSRKWRSIIALEVIQSESLSFSSQKTDFASDNRELLQRQKEKMGNFFHFYQKKFSINSLDRKQKLYELYEKKLTRFENPYLSLDPSGGSLAKDQSAHLMTVRILKSFAKSLDAHTSFFSEEEAMEMRLNLEKQFEGFGIILSEGIDGVIITDIIKDSPAHKSGQVHVNDLVVEIDGQPLKEVPFETVMEMMKKRDNPNLVLGLSKFSDNGQKSKMWRVQLKKAPIVMENDRLQYSFEPYGNGVIAKITLKSFYENGDGINSERDIRNAFKQIEREGPVRGLVLDLRENPGGFLSQAVKVAGLFISSGVVVISKYGKDQIHYLRSLDSKSFFRGPIVILTSKMTASAAEIVAQALQDYGVAVVVGDERTFGKGSIQYQTVTDEKADIFFKVTVGKYYTVSGRSTQVEGVKADILVPSIYAPFDVGEKYLEYPLPADRVPSAYSDSLSEVDEKSKFWFQQNYLPNLQRRVSFWNKLMPELKKNSMERMRKNPDFQAFLKTLEKIRSRLGGDMSIEIDLSSYMNVNDIQMKEATNILKDMIYFETKSRKDMNASVSEENPVEQAS